MTVPNDRKRNILGVLVDDIDYDGAVREILSAARDRRSFGVTALAVHGVLTGHDDVHHRHRLNELDLVAPDGQPVRWALNWVHGSELRDRVYGPELTRRLCREAGEIGLGVYLYGSTAEVVDTMARNLEHTYPGLRVAGTSPSLFRPATDVERDEIVDTIRTSGADLVFVGLGCPRQETFVYEMRDRINCPLIAVGAAFDYHAGHVAEPPMFVQRYGLQWLWRLLQNPRRMWRRYLIGNPRYAVRLAAQMIGIYRPDPADAREPRELVRPG